MGRLYADKLSPAAVKVSQAAFASLTKSLQCEWDFLQRVVPDCAGAFTPLNKKIKKQFFPAMLGTGVTEAEEALFALPTSLAVLGIYDPTKTAALAYQTSRQGTKVIVEAVKGVDAFDPAQHIETLQAARKHHVKTKEETYQSELNSILLQFSPKLKEPLKGLFLAKHQHGYLFFQPLPATLTCLRLNLEMGWQFAICMIWQTYLPSVMVVRPH